MKQIWSSVNSSRCRNRERTRPSPWQTNPWRQRVPTVSRHPFSPGPRRRSLTRMTQVPGARSRGMPPALAGLARNTNTATGALSKPPNGRFYWRITFAKRMMSSQDGNMTKIARGAQSLSNQHSSQCLISQPGARPGLSRRIGAPHPDVIGWPRSCRLPSAPDKKVRARGHAGM